MTWSRQILRMGGMANPSREWDSISVLSITVHCPNVRDNNKLKISHETRFKQETKEWKTIFSKPKTPKN